MSFDASSATGLFYGRRFTDSLGNYLHVPSAPLQAALLDDPAALGVMCGELRSFFSHAAPFFELFQWKYIGTEYNSAILEAQLCWPRRQPLAQTP